MECLHPNVLLDNGAEAGPNRWKFLGPLERVAVNTGQTPTEILKSDNYILTPCKRCLACQIRAASEWAARCIVEAKYYPDGEKWFVTLTYDQKHIPIMCKQTGEIERGAAALLTSGPDHEKVNTLWKDDLQKYHKRLRARLADLAKKAGQEPPRIKYLACGEYGPQTGRPHYHEILLGVTLPDAVLRISRDGRQYYESQMMAETWGFGNIMIEKMTTETAEYVARYTTKKLYKDTGKELYQKYRIQEPFLLMSRRPGIGAKFYEEHRDELKARPEIIVPTKKGSRTIALPRYFREKQKKDLTIEEQAEKITRLRERQLERVELAESYSSKGYMEKLQDEERRQKKRQAELNRKEQL